MALLFAMTGFCTGAAATLLPIGGWRTRLSLWAGLGVAAQIAVRQGLSPEDSAFPPPAAGLTILAGLLLLGLALACVRARRGRMDARQQTAEQLDAMLPQLQCGRCGYPGCLAYAKALSEGAPANRCAPGGMPTAQTLASALGRPLLPVQPWRSDGLQLNTVAVIREQDCVGCAKCIQACPTDAIIGARQMSHAVIASKCTGCDLCLSPCPTDCIDLISVTPPFDPQHSRVDFAAREERRLRLHNASAPIAPARATGHAATTRPPSKVHRRKTLAAIERALQMGDEATAKRLQDSLAAVRQPGE